MCGSQATPSPHPSGEGKNSAGSILMNQLVDQGVELRQAINSYANKRETMCFHSRPCAGRSHDQMNAAIHQVLRF